MEPILQFQKKLLKEVCVLISMVIFAKSIQMSKSKIVDLQEIIDLGTEMGKDVSGVKKNKTNRFVSLISYLRM